MVGLAVGVAVKTRVWPVVLIPLPPVVMPALLLRRYIMLRSRPVRSGWPCALTSTGLPLRASSVAVRSWVRLAVGLTARLNSGSLVSVEAVKRIADASYWPGGSRTVAVPFSSETPPGRFTGAPSSLAMLTSPLAGEPSRLMPLMVRLYCSGSAYQPKVVTIGSAPAAVAVTRPLKAPVPAAVRSAATVTLAWPLAGTTSWFVLSLGAAAAGSRDTASCSVTGVLVGLL